MHKHGLSDPSKVTKHQLVFDRLLQEIQDGKYKSGQKIPSEAALAQRFNTSRITVGRALRELKQRGFIRGVAGSGNFVRDAVVSGEALLFGLLIPNLGETEIFEPICQGLASAHRAGAYGLLWGHSSGSEAGVEEQALQLCEQFIRQKAAGVFFAPIEMTARKDEVNVRICLMLEQAKIPVVLLDRCILPFPQRSKYDLVGIDNRRAGYLATEHLLDLGCREIAFFAQTGAAPTIEARIAGYHEALIAKNVQIRGDHLHRMESFSAASVAQCMRAARANAIVCANDRVAGQVLHAVHELGMRVPQDVRIAGIDDVEYAHLLSIPLTTVHQPCQEIGKAAITAMFSRLERPEMIARDILLECQLVIRESTVQKAGVSPM